MKLSKAQRRDKRRRNSRKMGMSGKSLFLLEEIKKKRAEALAKKEAQNE